MKLKNKGQKPIKLHINGKFAPLLEQMKIATGAKNNQHVIELMLLEVYNNLEGVEDVKSEQTETVSHVCVCSEDQKPARKLGTRFRGHDL